MHKKPLIVLFFSTCFLIARAQNPPETTPGPEQILVAHNAYRTELGLAPLKWSSKLSAYAEAWANEIAKKGNCILKNRPYDINNTWNQLYGENVYKGSKPSFTILDAVKVWGNQKKYYNPKTKTCTGGECGSYTQIIWKETTEVGCATARCPDGSVIIVCNYDPAGNIDEPISQVAPVEQKPVTTNIPTNVDETPETILAAHNAYRSELGLPLLSWSSPLATYAEAWGYELIKSRNCIIKNRPHDKNDPWNQLYGENIYKGRNDKASVLKAIEYWGSFKKNFDPATKICSIGGCLSYTQMIWKETTEVGCALVKCPDGAVIVVCNYNPKGNMKGVLPY